MKILNQKNIEKIDNEIFITFNKKIVAVDVSDAQDNWTQDESNFNIYCVDNEYNIIWQVKETKTKVPFDEDPFYYVGQNEKGEIIADRFSGFEYKIDPETGEATRIAFHK